VKGGGGKKNVKRYLETEIKQHHGEERESFAQGNHVGLKGAIRKVEKKPLRRSGTKCKPTHHTKDRRLPDQTAAYGGLREWGIVEGSQFCAPSSGKIVSLLSRGASHSSVHQRRPERGAGVRHASASILSRNLPGEQGWKGELRKPRRNKIKLCFIAILTRLGEESNLGGGNELEAGERKTRL